MEKRRLSIEITEEDQQRMHNLIPWGIMSRMMRLVLVQMLDLLEEHGDVVLGALMSGRITVLDLIKKGGSKGGLVELTDDNSGIK